MFFLWISASSRQKSKQSTVCYHSVKRSMHLTSRVWPVFFNRAWCLSNPVVFAFIGVVCFTYPCWNAKNWWLRWAKDYLTAQSCKSLRYCSAGFSENLANSDPTPRCWSFAIWDEPRVPALQGEIFFMDFRWTSENWIPYPSKNGTKVFTEDKEVNHGVG